LTFGYAFCWLRHGETMGTEAIDDEAQTDVLETLPPKRPRDADADQFIRHLLEMSDLVAPPAQPPKRGSGRAERSVPQKR
jgi:hypothetical protein